MNLKKLIIPGGHQAKLYPDRSGPRTSDHRDFLRWT